MKVTIDKVEYVVKWKHLSDLPNHRVTECFIYCPPIDKALHFKGTAYCHSNDQFNKQMGRKLSMARALSSFCYEDRKAFWQAYDNEIGLDKTKKKLNATI